MGRCPGRRAGRYHSGRNWRAGRCRSGSPTARSSIPRSARSRHPDRSPPPADQRPDRRQGLRGAAAGPTRAEPAPGCRRPQARLARQCRTGARWAASPAGHQAFRCRMGGAPRADCRGLDWGLEQRSRSQRPVRASGGRATGCRAGARQAPSRTAAATPRAQREGLTAWTGANDVSRVTPPWRRKPRTQRGTDYLNAKLIHFANVSFNTLKTRHNKLFDRGLTNAPYVATRRGNHLRPRQRRVNFSTAARGFPIPYCMNRD